MTAILVALLFTLLLVVASTHLLRTINTAPDAKEDMEKKLSWLPKLGGAFLLWLPCLFCEGYALLNLVI